ncbi:sugar phosphate isomerase/epimerase family protein [Mucilaginibacter ginsenosidivorans]|uniref:Sugar phosphate isomerase/epimerase n=1 Tax=Mucilaginibacter ginsenosidivorans TaxID=398053 RepID=A0A5B8URX2_9SPHI|nr:sugar phosphate isomerase/epimerase family protein [Mucilaginibacter ginsenosidivorans]QEC61642.1 sugar phosphate isomerase/epimerase [Mucilaginibacter ginsenosidivorans]
MSKTIINRRAALQFIGLAAGASVVPKADASSAKVNPAPFVFSLNMSTIRGQNLGFMKELEVASKAGFCHVEIWIDSLHDYLKHGGTLTEVKTRLDALGLTVENCIAFAEWIVDDDQKRKKAIEQMKKEMDMVAQLGCKRIAATGKGLPENPATSLDTMAKRYRAVLEMGDETGVLPILELWGFQKKLDRVSEVTYIAMESGHKKANILLDVFHLYRGKTPLDMLSLLNPAHVDILHMNDYPATLAADIITDADRIYPGDGVAPIKRILKTLKRHDEPLILSAELFNTAYYKQDALTVAKTCLEKMKKLADGV